MRPGESPSQRNQRLFGTESPVAFVTGSLAARVGRVIARYMQSQQFRVVFHSRTKPEPQSLPEDSMLVLGDISQEQNVESWSQQIEKEFGQIDLVVNSAAIWEPKPLQETTAEDFIRFFEVNTLGSALVCKHFGLIMAGQETGGCLINIGDWAPLRPYRDFAAYFASKGSIETLTRTMAVELALRNPKIRVNTVLPGPVLLDETIAGERAEKIAEASLLQRSGTAEDVAEAVLFLATNPFVTGVSLPVDGGRSIFAGENRDAVAHPKVVPE